ncbi:hypothetical protein GA0116948_12023 [Chitinophaga costaii]|uniref:Uncharacterized protein n=1 Tax=Chitinophaga costaii TaxID=1335309 RepID=A0A1C4G2Q5_9BACT|nr:hypothetical protein [Chitinophaga costaii]PUZ19785.1 hypothetical protein DCM91_20135 [Chitinophaga costaii]SCC62384.1 hypothetical protein GA0116948_12023 [Chitinophaga costaii]
MKKIFIQYDFMVFLAAYFRQAYLSIWRSYHGTPSDLSDFYRSRVEPYKVVRYLSAIPDPCISCTSIKFKRPTTSFPIRRVAYVFNSFLFKPFLNIEEYCHTIELLSQLDVVIQGKVNIPNAQLSKLVQDIFLWIDIFTIKKIKKQDLHRIKNIEHHFQNESFITTPTADYLKNINL